MARAMDVLGDRWTLLLVRELLLGPKRFKDLLGRLPAMGANRLSERLAMLVDSGVIRPAAQPAPAYELTEFGEQLRQPVIALGVWGLGLPVDARIDPASARAELIALCLTGISDPGASAGLREVVEFEVGDEVFHISIDDGRVSARSGPAAEAAQLQVRCDLETFMGLAQGQLKPAEAVRAGRAILLRGSQRELTQVFKILACRQP
ncbi:transcriptional regulator [Duganella sp. LX20W]|uniref:Transcriptional regulator n=1 Tax=Rugamonas brunnea TaxID=2758569 RepID=A0A7W2EWR9_9BURK|nr:transcriptional regulator [Rugamonas brunnea]